MSASIKLQIAKALFEVLEVGGANSLQEIDGVEDIKVTQTDNLNAQIRVKTNSGLPRYFNVKISEMI